MSVVPIREDFRNLQPGNIMPLFLLYKKACGVAPRTLKDYREKLELFFRRFPDALDYPRERTQEFLGAYENPCSFNLYFAVLKCFWDWSVSEGYFRGDRYPLEGLKKRRPRHRIVQLSEAEISRLLKQPDVGTFAGLRDRTAMLLMIDSAIRPGEMLRLVPEDYNQERGDVTVRAESAKTGMARTLPLSGPTVDAMDKMIALRPGEWGDAPIFCSETGEPLIVQNWSRRVREYGERCGLKLSAYSLRHFAALALLRQGASAFAVQHVLGHTSLNTTKIYLAINDSDVRREHASAGVVLHVLGDDQQPRRERLRKV